MPTTTCDNPTVDGTIGHGDVTGLYPIYDIYDENFPQTTCNDATVNGMGREDEVTEYLCDAPAMMNYFSACNGQRHNYALLDYFCACNQNDFHFTMGSGIDYNLPSATLDDTVISNFGRKDTLSVTPIISTIILLWTATIIVVVAFVLHLSTPTSTTIKVGMKDVWTGLVEVFGMSRTNLLDERFIFKRKSGGAIITYLRNDE